MKKALTILSLALLGQAPDPASAPLPSARRRGADEIIIALAHRGPPRTPSRPARMHPARPRPARDPPRHAASTHMRHRNGPSPAPSRAPCLIAISK